MRRLVTVCLMYLVAFQVATSRARGAEGPAKAGATAQKADAKKVEAVEQEPSKRTVAAPAKKKTGAPEATTKKKPAKAARTASDPGKVVVPKAAKTATPASASKKAATPKVKKGPAKAPVTDAKTKKPAQKKAKPTTAVDAKAAPAQPAPRATPDQAAKNAAAIAQLQKELIELRRGLAKVEGAMQRLARAPAAASQQPAAPVAKAAPVAEGQAKAAVPPLAKAPAIECVTLDLTKHFNNDGISSDANRRDSDFDEHRQSYAAELLPEPGLISALRGIPGLQFIIPEKKDGAKNNVAADGQKIDVLPAKFNKLYVLGATTDGAQRGELKLIYEKAENEVELRLSDWCAPAQFGEMQAISMSHRHNWQFADEKAQCSMWIQTIDIDPSKPLRALILPKNRKMHVFAMTLARTR